MGELERKAIAAFLDRLLWVQELLVEQPVRELEQEADQLVTTLVLRVDSHQSAMLLKHLTPIVDEAIEAIGLARCCQIAIAAPGETREIRLPAWRIQPNQGQVNDPRG